MFFCKNKHINENSTKQFWPFMLMQNYLILWRSWEQQATNKGLTRSHGHFSCLLQFKSSLYDIQCSVTCGLEWLWFAMIPNAFIDWLLFLHTEHHVDGKMLKNINFQLLGAYIFSTCSKGFLSKPLFGLSCHSTSEMLVDSHSKLEWHNLILDPQSSKTLGLELRALTFESSALSFKFWDCKKELITQSFLQRKAAF